ncbi:MAG: GMC family oxidoreductase N-terminal domain-containing protein [Myxococcota bacterium]
MTPTPPLAARWLRAHGAADAEATARAAAARAARYPWPVAGLWPRAVDGLDRLAPLALLGRPTRASRLEDPALFALDAALQQHPLRAVRLLWLLARFPLLEARYAEPGPPDPGHPLHALADVLAERRALSNHTFDVVVVGTGAGGGPAGWALARAGLRVCFVEAGDLVTPATAGRAVERHYVEQGMLGSAAGGGMALVVAGRAVGGTTAINSGTSFRPLPERLDAWHREWGADTAGLDRHLDRVEAQLGVAPTPEALLDGSARLVREGLEALGRTTSAPLPRNAPDCRGAGRCCFGCPHGAKRSTDRAFLPEAVQAGATLLTASEVVGLAEDAGGVRLWVRTRAETRELRAAHVVLAGGAVATPQLLRSSRLGSAWRRAGRDLRIHPASKVFGWMPEPVHHEGVPQALGYVAPELPRVTFEGAHTPPAVTATLLPAAGERHRAWMAHYDHVANYGMMVRDRGTGAVDFVGGRPVLRYAVHDDDAADLGAALILAARALFAAGAERVLLPVAGRDPEVASPAALDAWRPADFPRSALLVSGFHPQGTAAVGRVLDRDHRVLGTRRIWVADAAAMPDSPGVNPQITIMALALRTAERLLEEGTWASAPRS